MRRSSRSPLNEAMLVGRIVIQNLPRRTLTAADIFTWLKKYGTILEIVLYKTAAIVQFTSDLEAAGAVQCEDGGLYFGALVTLKHAELALISSVRRSGPVQDRYTSDQKRSSVNARDRDPDTDRGRSLDKEREKPYPGERDPPVSRFDDPSRDRRRRRDEATTTRKQSRSPLNQRGDRRHVHPLNWLSEVASTDQKTNVNGSTDAKPTPAPPPYIVAIVALQHDIVAYAETIEKRVSACLKVPDHVEQSSPRTHIIVLLSADHLSPCLEDLAKEGVPFAIICGAKNWTHGSCTLRILYTATQQEHRNMPLDDAMTLLQKEYDNKLALEQPVPPVLPPPSRQHQMPDPPPNPQPDMSDDDTFIAPTRNLSTLLRMLADSRILSIGELDEIAAFVQERKRRLEVRRQHTTNAPADLRPGTSTDLKSRILNMIYPNSNSGTNVDPYTGMNRLPDATNNQTAGIAKNAIPPSSFGNPTVQQALNTVLGSWNQFVTPPPSHTPMSRMDTFKQPESQYAQQTRGGSFVSYPSAAVTTTNQPQPPMISSRFTSYNPASSTTGSNPFHHHPATAISQSNSSLPSGTGIQDSSDAAAASGKRLLTWDEPPNKKRWRGKKQREKLGGKQPLRQQPIPSLVSPATASRKPDLMSLNITPVSSQSESKFSTKAPLLTTTPGLLSTAQMPFYMPQPSAYRYPGPQY